MIVAGKSHPADDGGKGLIQQIVRFADRPQGDFKGHIMDPEPITMDEDGRLRVGSLETTE